VRPEFVYSVSREFAKSCQTPMLVLPDDVVAHPLQVSIDIASLCPNAEITVYPWKEPADLKARTINRARLPEGPPDGVARRAQEAKRIAPLLHSITGTLRCAFDVGDEPRVAHIKYANQNGDVMQQERRRRSLAFAAPRLCVAISR
jgi:hypothetical protein